MNSPFALPQDSAVQFAAAKTRVITITKPANGQSYTVNLSFDGSVKLDLSQIANEKITIVKVPSAIPGAGEKAIVLFDNQSTITIDPFFFSGQWPGQLTIDTGSQHDLTVSQFAAIIPVTEDRSILPAGGEQADQSGMTFEGPAVDPLGPSNPLALLPPEELPGWTATPLLAPQQTGTETDLIPGFGTPVGGVAEEEQLVLGAHNSPVQLSQGNEDATGNELDHDTPSDLNITTNIASGSLSGLVVGGDLPIHFSLTNPGSDTVAVIADGQALKSQGAPVLYHWIDASHVIGYVDSDSSTTFNGAINHDPSDNNSGPDRIVFELTVNDDGTFKFELFDQLDHAPGNGENLLGIDFSSILHIADNNGSLLALGEGSFTIQVIDDVPVVSSASALAKMLAEGNLDNFDNGDTNNDHIEGSDGNNSPKIGLSADFNLNTLYNNGDVKIGSDEFSTKTINEQVVGVGLFGFVDLGDPAAVLAGIQTVTATDGVNSQTIPLTSKGEAVDGVSQNGDTLTFTADGRIVFTVELDSSTGHLTFTLIDQLDHPYTDDPTTPAIETEFKDSITLDLSSLVQVSDFDGDSLPLAGGTIEVNIVDDIPTITARAPGETTVTETQTIDYDLHAGNVDVRGIGGGGHDLLLTGVDLNEGDNTVNTNNDKIGIGDGQSIDGFETHGPNSSGPEILTMEFVNNLDLNTDTFTGHDSFPSVKFSVDVAEAGPGDNPAVIFISATNHDDGANTDSFVALTFKVNDVSVSATEVFAGGQLVGYVLDSVPDNATIEAIGASDYNILKVGNYDNFQFDTAADGSTHEILTDGNSFKIYGIETSVTTTTVVTESFKVSEDESAGLNTAADPNAANDVNAPANGTDAHDVLFVADAVGYAKSAESVLVTDNNFTALFSGSVGADENPGDSNFKFAITDASGNSFNGTDSGLTTLDGTHILLTTDATTGALIGSAGGADVFKVYVDSGGFVWIAQYQPIDNSLAGSTQSAFDDIATVSVDGGLHIKATLTDFDHDGASAVSPVELQVQFQDDGPLAVDDLDVVANNDLTATGNVITGVNETTPGVDAVGTDGATVTDVTSNNEPGHAVSIDGSGVLTIVGEFGTLELHPDGEYTYTRTDGSPVTGNDVFSYTLTDGDGDTSSAELTITISDQGVTVTDLTPEARGGDATVWEAGLTDGSAGPNTTLTVQTGTFTISTPDGLQSLKVGDTVMSESDLLGASGSPITIAGGPTYGTLVITGYDNTTGEVSYQFTLTDNTLTHTNTTADATPGDVGSADQVFANYNVIVTDADNDSNSASPAVLSIAVNDDGPDAVNDTAAATNEGVPVQINVETNDTPGADGVDWSNPANNVTHTNAAHGTVVYNDDGTFTYTPNAGFDGNDSFTYTITDNDGDSDTATVSLTVNPVVGTPTIAVDLTGDHLVIKEDNSGTVKFTATAGATDVITSVMISGLDFSHASYVINGVTVSGGVAVYTVDFSGNPGNTGEVTVEIKPHEDSDVDVNTLSAVATAKDADHTGAGDPGVDSSSVSVPIVVDAVLDEYADVGQSPIGHGTEAITQQAVSLGLTLSFDNTTVGVPNSNFNAPSNEPFDTTQQDTVGPAEIFTVTIKVTGDVADLQLSDNTLGTLTETATPGTWTLTATHDNLAAAVAAVQAVVSANFDGTISGTIQAVSTDPATGGGDIEDSTLDNSVTDDANWSLTIDPAVGTPTVEVTAGLTNGDLLVKEDNNSTVTVKASVAAGSDDVLTGAVISGLVSGASYSIDGGPVFVSDGTDKTITLSGTTDTFTIQVFPPEDSDVDLGTIHVKATAADGNNPAVTADATTDIPVVVDAVLDQYVDATSGTPVSQATAASAQTFSLGITAAAATAPFTFSGAGNADTDSSESTTATITLNAALPTGASLSLAAGAAISLVATADPLVYTLTGSITEVNTALPLLQVTVPASYIGTISGTVSTTSVEANTPDGTVPASGSEPDTTDNTYTDATPATFSVTTTNTVPQVLDDTSSLKVYEAALATGTDPSSPAETDTDTNGLQFKATGENIVSIKFVDPNSLPVGITAPELDNLFSGTPTWLLSADGRTLTLKIDGQDTLVLTLTGATSIAAGGSDFVTVAATLGDNVLHQLPPSVLDVILSNVTVAATDSNGDAVFAAASVNIVDDAPLIDSIQNAIVANTNGVAVGEIHVNYGADGSNSTTAATVNVTTDAGAHTTNSGLVITGWDDLSGITETLSADGKMLTATIDATGGTFYTLQVDDSTNDYTLTYSARPVVQQNIDFTNDSGGAGTATIEKQVGDLTVTFDGILHQSGVFTDPNNSTDQLKPTGNGFGVGSGGGAGISNDEGFFVTVTHDVNGTPVPTTADSLSFSLLRNGGGSGAHTAQLHWIAYDADGNQIVGGTGFNAGSGNELITLVSNNTPVAITINPPGEYSKLVVWMDNEVGQNSVGIESFKIGTSVVPEDQPLHFDIAAVDGDGDISAASGLDVLLGGGAGPGFTLTGTLASEVLVGGTGNDILTGGGGADTLSGKAGADTFKYNSPSEGMDHIADFNAGEGDMIEILASAFGLPPADAGHTADQIAGLFDANTTGNDATTSDARFHFNAATHTLYYDSDGAGGAASVALATLDNNATIQAQNVHIV